MPGLPTLFSQKGDLACKTVRIALAEKGLRHELAPPPATEAPPLWQPPGQPPVAGLGDILAWLEQHHPSPALLPPGASLREFQSFCQQTALPFYDAVRGLAQTATGRAVDERELSPIQQATRQVYAWLDRLETRLGQGPFWLGEAFSFYDLLFIAPLLELETQDVPIPPSRAALFQWSQELLERPAAQS